MLCSARWSRSGGVPLEGLHESRIGVDGFALPPMFFGPEFEDREVQMRRIGIGVAGGTHKGDDIALFDHGAFGKPGSVVIEMRVVVAVDFVLIELVDRVATCFAQ